MNYQDVINKVYRRLMSGAREQVVQLTTSIDDEQTVIAVGGGFGASFGSGFTGAIQTGAILSCGMELMLVLGVQTGGNLFVSRGYDGSPQQGHGGDNLVYVNPRFSFFDIGVAINDDLLGPQSLRRTD